MGMIWLVATIVWAGAEASFFFIVPDVLLTYIALRFGLRTGLKHAVLAAFVAALTGAMLWYWGLKDIASAQGAMLRVPAVGPDLLVRAHDELVAPSWPLHMVIGAITGVPYKIYAVEAGSMQIPLLGFLLASFVARLLRFAGTIFVAVAANALALRMGITRLTYPGWVAAWIIVYIIYFGIRGVE